MTSDIQEALKNLKSRSGLLAFFRGTLGFHAPRIAAPSFDLEGEKFGAAEAIAEFGRTKIFHINLNIDFDGGLRREREIRTTERNSLAKITVGDRRHNLFIFSDKDGKYWDFVYPADYGRKLVLKRFTIRPDNRGKLRTPAEQLFNLIVKTDDGDKMGKKLEDAFSVEAVSAKFFEDFQKVFNEVKRSLLKQSSDNERVHRFVHQLFNRMMFFMFVERRGVFNNDKNFLSTFWNAYRNHNDGKNEFYDKWLTKLFFEALNGKFFPREYFKFSEAENFNSVLQLAPHLNGGLFKEDPEIDSFNVKLEDKLFVKIFEFLESYNFTIRENTPLDEDLEIDPEMLGNIYEMMVNVSEIEDEDERHKAGIFYTPVTEIDFMLRRSLVEYLFNKTKIAKRELYDFVFPETDGQKQGKFLKEEIKKLYEAFDSITIVDPACGSGHYLVVAVQIIFDLKKNLWKRMGNSDESFDAFTEKLKIIENSIFGVDVKKWAAEIAKLRLWLDLVVEAKDEQLHAGRSEALLPNLAFKIRVGDSLVQEVGGVFFKTKGMETPASLRAFKDQLIVAKKDYFYGRHGVNENFVKSRELQFFKALIDESIKDKKGKMHELESPLRAGMFKRQAQLIAGSTITQQTLDLPLDKKSQAQADELKEEIVRLEEEKKQLSMKSEFAFWPIEFAEILTGRDGDGGFDIVVANPPYVNYKMIDDPTSVKNPTTYKKSLITQLKYDWEDKGGALIKLSGMSDLYVYFYLKGLQLLNPEGVMCFISSNFWLDVDYGVAMQEVLLRRVPILAIYDNQAKRSFKHAAVNTIIAVFGAPHKKDWDKKVKENSAKFVMFKKPFEDVAFSEILLATEDAKQERLSNDDFRLVQKNQRELYDEGLEREAESGKLAGMGAYAGNKWGGKYLRAPDIYVRIVARRDELFTQLGNVAKVETGLKEPGFGKYIESVLKPERAITQNKFLPILKDVSVHKRIVVTDYDSAVVSKISHLKKKLDEFDCEILWLAMKGDRYITFHNPNHLPYTGNFFGIEPLSNDNIEVWLAVLNSTMTILAAEIFGRRGFGGGATILVKSDLEKLPILNANKLSVSQKKNLNKSLSNLKERDIATIFYEFGVDPSKPIREQEPKPLPDRKALDDIVFDALGLTADERKEVYWAVAELVQNRLNKAKSL